MEELPYKWIQYNLKARGIGARGYHMVLVARLHQAAVVASLNKEAGGPTTNESSKKHAFEGDDATQLVGNEKEDATTSGYNDDDDYKDSSASTDANDDTIDDFQLADGNISLDFDDSEPEEDQMMSQDMAMIFKLRNMHLHP
jgi:hypothetical protein